ncbi:MAG: histidine--tRNA ligase [Parvularculaceae bacterium]|nr:histidine--tRNA ligase [Parvularculaceae bacterium]
MTRTDKPKARTARGFRDRLGAEIAAERDMLARISEVYESWGFDPLDTPALEYTDALGKFLPDVDRPNDGVFSLQDDDEQWLSLRYDLTAPLARFVAENYDALPKPFRRYAVGPVWRNEKPGPGRYRQFTQCDADTVGAPAPFADAECIAMLAEAIEAAGVGRQDFIIRINDRNVLTGLLETIGLGGDDSAPQRLKVLRAMDKFTRLGDQGVRQLLGIGRKDESGDFTEGARLEDVDAERVITFMKSSAPTNVQSCSRLMELFEGRSAAGAKGVETLSAITELLKTAGYDESRVIIDLTIIRGLEYYTGPVFEAELLTAPLDEQGRPVRFGAIASGGRYDDLVRRFKGVEVPAVGVSVGVSRLLAALDFVRGRSLEERGPVVVLALEKDRMADYQAMAAELRRAGVRAEVYLGGAGMKAQLKYADKRGAPLAVIQGSDERARGEVTIKDLVLGARLAREIEDNVKWREGQAAQISVPRAQMVDAAKRIIEGDRAW